jgi:carbamoyl-phosphate synthase large subunit
MNIILTCVGRRNYLVDYFRSELIPSGGKVYVTSNHPNVAGFCTSDGSFIVPSLFDPNYVDVLIGICKKHAIRAIIPCYDLELPVLSKARDKFIENGIFPVVSSLDVVNICNDK